MKKQVLENPAKNQDNGYFLMIIACLLVTIYLTSNIMAVKIINIGGVSLFDAGTITFPFAYMLGDALTEVWGFKVAKKVIILSFICNIIMVGCTALGLILPAPDYMAETTYAYSIIFGYVPRIVIASLLAFLCGELLNAWTLVKIKEKTGSKKLWARTIGSSVVGHLVDTTIFVFVAFAGTTPFWDCISMIWIQYIAKLGIEALAGTPLAYGLITWLKRKTKETEISI